MRTLTPEQVAEICRRYRAGDKVKLIQLDFNLCGTELYDILDDNHVPRRRGTTPAISLKHEDPPDQDPPAVPGTAFADAPFPAWSDKWPAAVQLKWLEIWESHHPISK